MESVLQNLILAGLGTMAYSYEKATALIEQLIKRGELTLSQGKELNEELKRRMATSAKPQEGGAAGADLPEMRATLEEIRSRLSRIEEKIDH